MICSIVVFMQVLLRYVFLQPLAWGEETARFLFIWIALLGAALGVKDRAHFAITMVVTRFPRPLRFAAKGLIALGGSYLFFLMITEGWTLVLLNRNQESPALGLVMSIPYLVIPVSGLLMLIFTWGDLLLHWGDDSLEETQDDSSAPMMLE